MNKEIIDKWLENEYGVSYTRLEKLHDFVVEQDLKHQEQKDKQIQELTNNWNELEEYFKQHGFWHSLDKMKEIKESNDVFSRN